MSSAENSGCVIILVDESAAMRAVAGDIVADGKPSTKSNAERVATCLNSLLAQLADGPDFELAIVGYKTDQGQVNIGCRWGSPLTGREFVKVSELIAAPLRVEHRARKAVAAGGTLREESVPLPIWYEPTLGDKAPQIAAYDYCRELLTRWLATAGPGAGTPLIVHVFSGGSGDGNPQMAVGKLMELAAPGGKVLLLQGHLATSAATVPTVYPSSFAYLPAGGARDQFRRASELPAHLADALRNAKIPINANARGMLHNGKIADLIRLLGLIKSHARTWPSATAAAAPIAVTGASVASSSAAPTPESSVAGREDIAADEDLVLESGAASGAERAGLVIFVLDRSVADPYSGNLENACLKLQQHANDLLKQLSKLKQGQLDVAILSYGLNGANEIEVRDTFDGPLAGRTRVPHTELAAGALRVDEHEEQVSNGIGGLVSVTRKNPIYYDIEPTAGADPAEAFAKAAEVVAAWRGEHPQTCLPPLVLHLTRGECDPAAMDQALAPWRAAADPTSLTYHLIVTESPHKAVAYPESDSELESPSLQSLWQVSGPLLDRERLSTERPTVKAGSRGFVINGKFDLLARGIEDALASA